jgi:hypothetical protein
LTPEAAAIVLATPIPVNVELSPCGAIAISIALFVSTQLLAFVTFRAIRMHRMTLRRAGCRSTGIYTNNPTQFFLQFGGGPYMLRQQSD